MTSGPAPPALICFCWLCVVLGLIGVVVPGLPKTPFLLLAAWVFSRSSEKFQVWLLNHPGSACRSGTGANGGRPKEGAIFCGCDDARVFRPDGGAPVSGLAFSGSHGIHNDGCRNLRLYPAGRLKPFIDLFQRRKFGQVFAEASLNLGASPATTNMISAASCRYAGSMHQKRRITPGGK